MMGMEAIFGVLDMVKASLFPISATFLFCCYPMVLLVWTVLEGRAAGHVGKAKAAHAKEGVYGKPVKRSSAALPLMKRVHGLPKVQEKGASARRCGLLLAAVFALLSMCFLAFTGNALSFVVGAAGGPSTCGKRAALPAASHGDEEDSLPSSATEAHPSRVTAAAGVAGSAGIIGMAVALRCALHGPASESREKRGKGKLSKMKHMPRGVLRRCASSSEALYMRCEQPETQGVRWYATPPDAAASMWHHVDLHVKTWLDEDTGLFRYVNEIPMGALQKFELQTRIPRNVIREDAKGSRKLKAFGRPVPFNYGCFPQTYRDPDEVDEIFGAPGDDDPLDVLDLSSEAVGVGEVVTCRALGAVCLIDEGQADWKIIVLNANAKGPLSSARSIEDVERIAPGRIEESLRWMDEFKQSSSQTDTTLHYEIHEAARAVAIIEQDYVAWQRLIAEAGVSGCARGHWIRGPHQEQPQPQVMSLGWATPLPVPGQAAHVPSSLAGSSIPVGAPPAHALSHTLTMRRQTSVNSDGGDSSSGPRSSDSEFGA